MKNVPDGFRIELVASEPMLAEPTGASISLDATFVNWIVDPRTVVTRAPR